MDQSLLSFIYILLGATFVLFFIYIFIKGLRRVIIPWIRGSRHRRHEMLINYGPGAESEKDKDETTFDTENEEKD